MGTWGCKGFFFPNGEIYVIFRMVGLWGSGRWTSPLMCCQTEESVDSDQCFLLVGNVKLKRSNISEMSVLWKTTKLPIFVLL